MSTLAQANSTIFPAPVSLTLDGDQKGRHSLQIGILQTDGNVSQWQTKPLQVQVDSGSCGLVIPSSFMYQWAEGKPTDILLDGVTKGDKATVKYQPSADDLQGYYYTIARLALGCASDGSAQVVLSNIKVIGVDNRPAFMMGVGFSQPVLADNPFLSNGTNPQGQALYPSYYIDSEQIVLGVQPPADVQYQTLELKDSSSGRTEPMQGVLSITKPGSNAPILQQVSVLLDTGLDLMMVARTDQLPVPSTSSNDVGGKLGIQVTDTALQYEFPLTGIGKAQMNPQLQPIVYTTPNSNQDPRNPELLNLGDGPDVSGPSPSLVYVIPPATDKAQANPARSNFVNTGFNPLFASGMLFDKQNCRVGFFKLGQ